MSVIPEPLSVEAPSGMAPTSIAPGATIHVPAGDAGARAAARYLSDLVARTRGLRLNVQVSAGDAAGIDFVRRADPAFGAEGYAIEVGGDGRVRIAAASDAGLFYGAVTLWELMTPGHGPVTLQPSRIEDRPRFAWRGLLLDSARHYQSPAFVERLIDWMALHKLNVLEWHLTDDQGWRLQIRRYPRLTTIGAWRTQGGRRYGGFYTQAQVRRIVALAQARHVTIVPEIEMPGHALAAILAYPQLGSAAPPPSPRLRSDWGIFPYLFAPSDRTFTFLDNVLTEVMELFPSPYISVGGDEAIKDEWQASPAIQAQIKSLGLGGEDALQGWFTDRIAAFLAAHDRRLMGWDDILAGGALPANAAVASWHLEGAAHAAQAGHDVVISTDPVLYFDHRQTDLPSEPPGRGIVVSLRDVYQYEPAPADLPADQRAHIVGVQADIWTEHIRTESRAEAMTFPRAAAVAELAWADPGRKDWSGFVARLPDELARYRAFGLTPDDGALRVKLDAAPNPAGGLAITLSNQLGFGQVRYSTDGAAPTARSAEFKAPIVVTRATRIRAATFADQRQLAPALSEIVDPSGAQQRLSQQLAACSGKLVLNLEGATAAQRLRPYLVDIMNPCWIYPQADLANVRTVMVAVARLPFNFQLAHDTAKLVRPTPTIAGGELDVRADGCSGELMARFPLTEASRSPGVTTLTLPVSPRAGRHDLCLAFATGHVGPLWVIDSVELSAAMPLHTEASR